MIVKQSTARKIPFYLVSATDNVTPITGLGSGPVVTLSKDGAAFGAAGGSVAEIGNGWYYLSANTTDTATLGSLVLHATGTGAVSADDLHEVCVDLPGATVSSVTGAVGSVTGAVGSVTGLTAANLDVAVSTRLATGGYTAPDNATIAAIAGYVDTEVAAIKAKTDNLPASPAATSDIPSASSIATAVWNALTSALTTVNSIGKLLVTNVDAKISLATSAGGIQKNVGVDGFQFQMFDDNGDPALDLTVTGKVSLEGAAFIPLTNAPTEIGNGWYTVDLANADVNGKTVAFKFTAGGAQTTGLTLVTETPLV